MQKLSSFLLNTCPIACLLNKAVFASRAPLLRDLKKLIREEGPMTLERYMRVVLQDSDHGYYRQGDPIGSAKDFSTAPEISQMFGEMIGLWCLDAWERMGKPDPFVLLELGPGHGTLLHDLLAFLEPAPAFRKALRLRLFESNATLRDLQKDKLAAYSPAHIDTLDKLDPVPVIAIANELFDNIPLRQFIKTPEGWRETLVGLCLGRLTLMSDKKSHFLPPDPFSADALEQRPEGWVHEYSEESRTIVNHLAAHMVRYGGAGIVLDYGYVSAPGVGTLDGWRQSKPSDILACPGKTDVTANVDFSALSRTAKEAGAFVEEVIGQGAFLLRLGIANRAESLKEKASEDAKKRIEKTFYDLIAPARMGDIWKALVFRAQEQV